MARLKIARRQFDINMQDLEQKAASIKSCPIPKLTHVVEIQGKVFPIKRLVAEVTGLPADAILTYDAYKTLEKLGCEIQFRR